MNLEQVIEKRVEGIAKRVDAIAKRFNTGLKVLVASEMLEAVKEDCDFIFKALALLDFASSTNHVSRLRYALEQRDYGKHD